MPEATIVIALLCLHITSGFLSLCSAFAAMASAKGQTRHRQFGRYFFYGMTGVFITALPLAYFKKSLFLFLIAIFSYYLALSGWRYAKMRSGQPSMADWLLSTMMLSASIFMIARGAYLYSSLAYQPTILLVFGGIGGLIAYQDIRDFRQNTIKGSTRIAKHLTAMLGATIAALTAFLVTNVHIQHPIILWLAPTALIVPFIIWWKRKVLSGKY